MREMHKWKDKVELSLDNRQIFFLFFGLSVVGCFVFALGVMVGRRVDFGPEGEVAVLAGESLALLDGEGDGEAELSFEQGLAEPAHEGLPATRDPEDVEKDDGEPDDAAEKSQSKKREKPRTGRPKGNESDGPSPDQTVLSGGAKELRSDAGSQSRKFTLQMKAFSKKEQAEAFAEPLRANGHQVRVESHEIKGRIWHRVRVGAFDSWQDGLAAKEDFEQQERVIAYVVRM